MQRFIFLLSFYFSLSTHIHAQQKVSRKSDIVYDHKDGLAFVFDVISPEKKNGAAILYILSGGWVSREASTMNTDFCKYYTDKGYTVFIITHCSQPRYNVPEIISQVQRAIRFIRFNAVKFGVDPNKFGVSGHSAGGHLSIAAAVFGKDSVSEKEYRINHSISADQKIDPIELVSSKIQAVTSFFPPTNFVNYIDIHTNWFDFLTVRNVSENGSFVATPDSSRETQNKILKSFSPYYFISEKTPPICIIHGTADDLVPFSQSVSFVARLMEYNVPYLFVPREGRGHGWKTDSTDINTEVNWFDKYFSNK